MQPEHNDSTDQNTTSPQGQLDKESNTMGARTIDLTEATAAVQSGSMVSEPHRAAIPQQSLMDADSGQPGAVQPGALDLDATIDLSVVGGAMDGVIDSVVDLDLDVAIDASASDTLQADTDSDAEEAWPQYLGLTPAAHGLLNRSAEGLLRAASARQRSERYVAAHAAALCAATAVLATRGAAQHSDGPQSVWQALPGLAPELGEWAEFFSATAPVRVALESGQGATVSVRTADDMVRDAQRFHHLVESVLGLPYRGVLPEALPACE